MFCVPGSRWVSRPGRYPVESDPVRRITHLRTPLVVDAATRPPRAWGQQVPGDSCRGAEEGSVKDRHRPPGDRDHVVGGVPPVRRDTRMIATAE